ncbi:MAG TPA: mitomycin antibiotic biosynthesis protein, partial [Chloroflexota bacterium]|nr:mitomycin antibiotic biosynthesis protein [Chloroflexota bacterium]
MSVLTTKQRDQFLENGYLVVENVLDPAGDIAPLIAEYSEVLDGIARSLSARGAISSLYEELGFVDRLIKVCEE